MLTRPPFETIAAQIEALVLEAQNHGAACERESFQNQPDPATMEALQAALVAMIRAYGGDK
jgi:hypothetical protein